MARGIISRRMRKLSHSPAAKAKRARTMAAILAYRKAHAIPPHQKLTAKQKREARGFEHIAKRYRIYGGKLLEQEIERGSIPIANIGPRPKQAKPQRTYMTSKRVDLAADIVSVVKALQPDLARTFLSVLRAVLNGA